jgi:hypothetical protein
MTMTRGRKPKAHKIPGKYAPGTVHTLELTELFETLHRDIRNIRNSRPVNRELNDWDGGLLWNESLDAAELGKWDPPTIGSITLPQFTSESEDTRYSYDVIGQSLDVAAYVSGEPECWQVEEPVRKPCGRIIRLAVEIGGNCNIHADSMANRGRAIAALINSLELQGHSIELTLVNAYTNRRGEDYTFLIPVKHAGQSIDIKRVQFMIGHPSFYRRLLFGLVEIAQGESISTCMLSARNYIPSGFNHISYSQGLSESQTNSLRWAEEFSAQFSESIAA